VLPLQVRLATCRKKPVRTAAWVKAHIAAANRLLAPHGVRLEAQQESFQPDRCRLISRRHRDALARHAMTDRVTVLVVERVQDLALPSYNLMGVHWRYRGADARLAGRRWILLTARARPPVLAHALCHFFGLRHDPAGGNLMTPGPSDPIWRGRGPKPAPYAPLLTKDQGVRLRAAASQWLRTRGPRR